MSLPPRYEIFADAVARGARIGAAAKAAGYHPTHGSVLIRDPAVKARIAETRAELTRVLNARNIARTEVASLPPAELCASCRRPR